MIQPRRSAGSIRLLPDVPIADDGSVEIGPYHQITGELNSILEVEAMVEPFEDGRGFTLSVR